MTEADVAKRAIHQYAAMAVELDDIAREMDRTRRPLAARLACRSSSIARRACRAEQLALLAREQA